MSSTTVEVFARGMEPSPAAPQGVPEDAPSFRVMQFNVLAHSLSSAFPHATAAALHAPSREELVVQEILQFRPDVLALQELDFYPALDARLRGEGYARGLFLEKVSRNVDGSALFFRADAFALVEDLSCALECSQSQVLAMARLRHARTGREVVFASAHYKAKEGFEEIRLRQTEETLRRMHAAAAAGGADCVLCGDFNATPDEPSYALATAGRASWGALEARSPLGPMRDAYAPGARYAAGSYTTFKRREKVSRRVSDYVLFTPGRAGGLCCRAVASIPADPDAAFPNHLPCEAYASDHLAVAADLVFSSVKP